MKIKWIILFVLTGMSVFAQPGPNVEIEITPSEPKIGSAVININIDSLQSKNYDRLILLTLPMEMTPSIPVSNSHKFNGNWFIDNEENKTQLWLGNILTAGDTRLKMQIEMQNIMRYSENVNQSYILKICPNHSDGLHKFLSLTDTDSIEIVFANKVIFRGNRRYPVSKVYPESQWKETDENIRKYTISSQNSLENAYLIFGIPNANDEIKVLGGVAVAFIVSFLTGLGVHLIIVPEKTQTRWKVVIALIGCSAFSVISYMIFFTLFNNLEVDGKIVLESVAPIIGYFAGVLIGSVGNQGNNDKTQNKK